MEQSTSSNEKIHSEPGVEKLKQLQDHITNQKGLWVFGYGSLTFRPDFSFQSSGLGVLANYVRRFHQGSTDHRGVPGKPGRVVTLEPQQKGIVYGRLFFISIQNSKAVLEGLDFREKGGYSQRLLSIRLIKYDSTRPGSSFPKENAQVPALVYYAHAENKNYLGPASVDDIATVISKSIGPSGPNWEYLYGLYQWLQAHRIKDSHVETITLKVIELRNDWKKFQEIQES